MQTNRSKWPEIAIIGSYPPPYGGIGVHLQRLVKQLEDEGFDYILYNTVSGSHKPPRVVSVSRYKKLWYLKFCFKNKSKIIHNVSTSWPSRLMFGIVAALRPGKYILSIHGRSINVALKSHWLKVELTRWLLRKMDVVIACNPDIERECIEKVDLNPNKVRMIPAFIPPNPERAPKLPKYIQDFINSKKPLISAVGWIGQQTYQGSDAYGIDMMIELVRQLKKDYPQIGLILSVNGGDEREIKRTIELSRQCFGDSMFFITDSLEDISLVIKSSDLFIRPTNTDGDAVSIREALYLGTPVVARDAAPRPEPCVIFRTRDIDDFEEKVRKSLAQLPDLNEKIKSYKMPDNAKKIMEIYKQLLAETN